MILLGHCCCPMVLMVPHFALSNSLQASWKGSLGSTFYFVPKGANEVVIYFISHRVQSQQSAEAPTMITRDCHQTDDDRGLRLTESRALTKPLGIV